ncbi:heme peroxidase [Tribonema minus]|uniref:Heme peroxidase n=1 Tax=Tribonema minus TaxID=303371 RepID=A0A835Z2D1_9STRA|nr:heme peroxidase [Tribonema minus]
MRTALVALLLSVYGLTSVAGTYKGVDALDGATMTKAQATINTKPAAINCSKKRQFDVQGIYGDMDNALKCFKRAVSVFESKGDDLLISIAAKALRASFHDCGTFADTTTGHLLEKTANTPGVAPVFQPPQCGGCNGSIKQEMEVFFQDPDDVPFFLHNFPQHADMRPLYEFLWGKDGQSGAAAAVRAYGNCYRMTNADMLSIMGLLAVKVTGGTPVGGCGWYPGRPDLSGFDDTNGLPGPQSDDQTLESLFGAWKFNEPLKYFGLSLDDSICILSGAHTLGKNNVGESQFTIPSGPLDSTPFKFDGKYFAEVVYGRNLDGKAPGGGGFASDRHGVCDKFKYIGKQNPPPAAPVLQDTLCDDTKSNLYTCYKKYADAHLADRDGTYSDYKFKHDFCNAFQAMSMIGMNMPPDYSKVAHKFTIRGKNDVPKHSDRRDSSSSDDSDSGDRQCPHRRHKHRGGDSSSSDDDSSDDRKHGKDSSDSKDHHHKKHGKRHDSSDNDSSDDKKHGGKHGGNGGGDGHGGKFGGGNFGSGGGGGAGYHGDSHGGGGGGLPAKPAMGLRGTGTVY